MKKAILISALLAALQINVCHANKLSNVTIRSARHVQDTLENYTGKYQRTIHNDLFYIDISLVDGKLVGTTLWDGNKMLLKHLTGDNFIVSGLDWSVKFMRDKDKKITHVLIMGTDDWVKVKN